MKRGWFILVFFLIFSEPFWAQKYEQSVLGFIGLNTRQGFEPSPVYFSGLYDIHSKRFDAEGGLKIGSGSLDFTTQGSYRFLRKDKITLGTGIIYNLN